jgi:hypothetical protein
MGFSFSSHSMMALLNPAIVDLNRSFSASANPWRLKGILPYVAIIFFDKGAKVDISKFKLFTLVH